MAIQLKMPALSPTMEEGTLAKWFVKEGDEVTSGDILAEIETDKATMEFEAIDEGVITKILVAAGTDEVAVGNPRKKRNLKSWKPRRRLRFPGPMTRPFLLAPPWSRSLFGKRCAMPWQRKCARTGRSL